MTYYKTGELGEFITLKRGYDLPQQNRKNGCVPIFSSSGISGTHDAAMVKAPGVITGRYGTIGQVFMANEDFWPLNTTLYVEDFHGNNPRFIYYFLKTLEWEKFTSASAVPGINRNTVHKEVISLPDIETQDKIASVLKTLDDKIEINQKINDNLQQQARAIYKEWFIDFGQTSGTTPATWKHGKLKDVLQLHKRAIKAGANTTLPYLPIDTIPMQSFGVTEFRPNDEAKSSLITFQKDDIIVGAMRVYFHRVVLAPCDGITRTTCFTLSPYNSKYLSYALLTCDLDSSIDHAQNTSKGSTMPYAVWDGGMGEIEIVIPPIDVAEEFNNIVLPMLRQIQRNCEEIKLLGSLRDTLLPKLMSGEIDVSGIQH